MRIYGNNKPVSNIKRVKGKNNSPSQIQGKQISQAKPVEISNLATELASLQTEINNTPDVRLEKVDKLKASIDNNKYEIDIDKLADKLVDFISPK